MVKIQNTIQNTSNADKDVEQQELIGTENENCKATLENSLADPYRTKHTQASWYLSK